MRDWLAFIGGAVAVLISLLWLPLIVTVVAVLFYVRWLLRLNARATASNKARTEAEAKLPRSFEKRSLNGCPYEVSFTPDTRVGVYGRPATLSFAAATGTALNLQLRRESLYDRLGKRLGVATEFQTGNTAFDARWYLHCKVSPKLGMWLQQTETQGLIESVMRAGFTDLWHVQGWLHAEWTHYKAHQHPWPDDAAIAALCNLASSMPAGESAPEPRQLSKRVVLYGVVLGLASLAILEARYPPVRVLDLWNMMWALGLIGAALFAGLAGGVLRGYARSHFDWGVLTIFGTVACLIGSNFLLAYANGADDPSPVIARQARVIDFRLDYPITRGGASSPKYSLTVVDWQHQREQIYVNVDPESFARVKQGVREVEILTKAGRLGVEWMTSYRVPSLTLEDDSAQ